MASPPPLPYLQDELNERDKTIRKYEQEIDSYSFRNQQLEKRVSILQSDLMEKGKKVNKKQPVPASSREDNQDSSNSTAALEELLTKIDENVQLSRQVRDSKFEEKKTFRIRFLMSCFCSIPRVFQYCF